MSMHLCLSSFYSLRITLLAVSCSPIIFADTSLRDGHWTLLLSIWYVKTLMGPEQAETCTNQHQHTCFLDIITGTIIYVDLPLHLDSAHRWSVHRIRARYHVSRDMPHLNLLQFGSPLPLFSSLSLPIPLTCVHL